MGESSTVESWSSRGASYGAASEAKRYPSSVIFDD